MKTDNRLVLLVAILGICSVAATTVFKNVQTVGGGNSTLTGPITINSTSDLTIASGAPSVTTNKIYNDAGTIKFNGSAIGGASDPVSTGNITSPNTDQDIIISPNGAGKVIIGGNNSKSGYLYVQNATPNKGIRLWYDVGSYDSYIDQVGESAPNHLRIRGRLNSTPVNLIDIYDDQTNITLTFAGAVKTTSPASGTAAALTKFGGLSSGVLNIDSAGTVANFLSASSANNYTVYAAGTAYSLTATPAALDFGTTDPTKVIDVAGTYLIFSRAYLKYNAATYAGTQTATIKLRRTNNTAGDLTNATTTATLRIITTITDTVGIMELPPVLYTTANIDDSISIFGSVSAVPAAGSVDVTEASIVAIRLY